MPHTRSTNFSLLDGSNVVQHKFEIEFLSIFIICDNVRQFKVGNIILFNFDDLIFCENIPKATQNTTTNEHSRTIYTYLYLQTDGGDATMLS